MCSTARLIPLRANGRSGVVLWGLATRYGGGLHVGMLNVIVRRYRAGKGQQATKSSLQKQRFRFRFFKMARLHNRGLRCGLHPAPYWFVPGAGCKTRLASGIQRVSPYFVTRSGLQAGSPSTRIATGAGIATFRTTILLLGSYLPPGVFLHHQVVTCCEW